MNNTDKPSAISYPNLVLRLFFTCLTLAAVFAAHTGMAQETSKSPGWVVLPIADYRALHARAFPAEREPEPPPVDATLTRVDYELRVHGDLASGRATLAVDVLKDGWVRVPIPPGLLVREAKLDGKLVSLIPATEKRGTQLSAVLSHPGRATLLLEIALPVGVTAGEESLSLPAAVSGVTRASVELPRQGVDIRLGGGLLSEHSETSINTKWVAFGRGGEPLSFTWRRKTEDHRAAQPLRWRGSLTELLGLGEDTASVYAEVNAEVTQGQAREVRMQLPANITVNQVLGAMVSDWEPKQGQLKVTFLEPVEQNARFVITGETKLPRDGQVDVPLLRLIAAEREEGGVAVEVLGAGEIKDTKPHGLDAADASDLGEMVAGRQSPSLVAFRYRAGDPNTTRSLGLNMIRYEQQAVLLANVEEARYRVLLSRDGKTLVEARYAVRNNQRNFLKVTLPSGASLWSASLRGKPVRPGQTPDGSLLLPLEKAHGENEPAFELDVLYLTPSPAWTDKGRAKITLPALDLPISKTGLQLYYPPLFKVSAETGTFRATSFAPPASSILNEVMVSGELAPAPPPLPKELPISGRQIYDLALITPGVTSQNTKALVDKYKSRAENGHAAGILPIHASFPAFGPSIYLVSELTSENQAASADVTYQQDKKRSGK